jgi:hypothetical protein
MNQSAFVLAAYAVMLVATASLLAWAFATMRTAEAAAAALKRPE